MTKIPKKGRDLQGAAFASSMAEINITRKEGTSLPSKKNVPKNGLKVRTVTIRSTRRVPVKLEELPDELEEQQDEPSGEPPPKVTSVFKKICLHGRIDCCDAFFLGVTGIWFVDAANTRTIKQPR
eukprot:Lithocolla_globosa_v1_NODE_868_length_3165_cov_84.746624.p2 type:complete len:125 gc:universal NODE_868_length_3165_cov_84.746624:1039-665(-)